MSTQTLLADWRVQAAIFLFSDSSAARAAMQRKGLGGKLRHVRTRHLWLQGHVAMGHVAMGCVAGVDNPADVLTNAPTERHCDVGRWLQVPKYKGGLHGAEEA